MNPNNGHPYYPPLATIPKYTPNSTPVIQLISLFGAIVSIVVFAAYRSPGHKARGIDRFAAGWFSLCGFLHIAFEGYYIYNRVDIAGLDTIFAQLWKEYTLSDSRYLTLDVFTVCVETITVFIWGPLSLLTLLFIITDSPLRHACQIVLCTAHLYGVALYYLTNWTEGVSYSRPEALYFWIYYVGFNLPWAVVPFWFMWDSFREIGMAFDALKEKKASSKMM